jgi:predicted GNAT family acetyltransferase
VPDVIDLPEQSRFELNVDGQVAELVYRVEGRNLVLIHTEVPEALGGRGIGGRLVQAAVDRAAADGLTIVARCPFARRWLEHHPDATAHVPPDGDTGRQ